MVQEKEGKPQLLERKTVSDATTLLRNQSEAWKSISQRQSLPAYLDLDNWSHNALAMRYLSIKYTQLIKQQDVQRMNVSITKYENTRSFELLQLEEDGWCENHDVSVEVNTNKSKC